MNRFICASVLALFLIYPNSASAEDTVWDHAERDLAKIGAWLKDAEIALRINTDPILRAIVCRLGFHRISVGAISRATGVNKKRLMDGVRELMALGLVNVSDVGGNYDLLEPADRVAETKLRRWAYDWCTSEDQCEVAH